ncbi:U4/U6.U5 tri-snRNP-associated protein 1 [Fopius arisanus]|uniref:U4/U6.U5 tri-snRNP-associated protein 1 n=2 Tax=Fopius arisanus TaxID=64838 RepID=A0A9R1TXC5_9HYME|nr:PREDICTED: U4/U6.U5 tri-snRNP-associated protein 1 [Fopius arisanus]
MGSSKRHKSEKSREGKKRRHRSRSRSRSRSKSYSPERHSSRHHKKHKRKERKEYDSDVEIVSAPPPPKISRPSEDAPPPPKISTRPRSPSPKGGAAVLSCSIEETNKLRAQLGLKPLEVDTAPSKEDPNKLKDDLGEFYHKPAENTASTALTQKYRERIDTHKQKRKIEANLSRVQLLGDDDSNDDANLWVEKTRKLAEEKKKAEDRAKLLEEMEAVFGVESLVKEEVQSERKQAYTERDLRGLRVEHDIENFAERNVILTLKDKGVLDNEDDVLENVNMRDDERYKKSVMNKKKKPGYDAYDDDNFDEFGLPKNKVLEKYDEEIDGERKQFFALGVDSAKEADRRRSEIIKQKLSNKRLETIKPTELKLASEYYNEEELSKFKKIKKKKKVKRSLRNKVLTADDLIPDTDYLRDLGSRRRKRPGDSSARDSFKEEIKTEDEYREELQFSRKQQKLLKPSKQNWETIADLIKTEVEEVEDNGGNIEFVATAEFCRTLGDIPTYGLAGNREDNDQDIMDFEEPEVRDEVAQEEDDGRGAWNTVEVEEKLAEPVAIEAAILDIEPSLGQGVGGALKLAMSKGYLQKEDTNRPSISRFAHLQAQNYSIEDKTYGDDDKFGRRDRFNGPTSEFKERDGFKPNPKLEYIDDDGHVLTPKEAFRYLSHKFHGKGPGKNKVEKRMKKAEQEVLMKRMSSTDTPLGTLNLLQAKQKETQSPFIVLSGSKQMNTTISKSKH